MISYLHIFIILLFCKSVIVSEIFLYFYKIFTEQYMPLVTINASLTLHKIGFYLKFPATLFLELEIDRTYQTITSDLALSKQPFSINKQIRFETAINFNSQSNTYETKKINIVIYIKTKTSTNKLSAGVITLEITRPALNMRNAIAKPNRCNDPKAFIQYSLRTESSLKIPTNPESRSQSQQKKNQGLSSTQPNIFKSAVHYINHHNEQQEIVPTNQLDKYLNDSLNQSRNQDRRRFKSSGKLPSSGNRLNQQNDDSRTERMGYRRDKIANDCSIISSQESIAEKKVKELSKKSEALSRQFNQTKHNNDTLLYQIKDLKAKIKQYQFEIQQQSTTIAILTKKLELKENSLGQQLRSIRTKLQESDSLARQLLLEKNQLLNQKENKQIQCVFMIKQKEKQFSEEKRRFMMELQEKRYQIESLIKQKGEFWDEITHAQGLADDLIKQNTELKQRVRQGTDNVELLSKQLALKTQQLKSLVQQQKNKGKNNQQSKNQRKLIFQLKKQKQQKSLTIKQQKLAIQQLKQKLVNKDEEIKAKLMVIASLEKELESLKKRIEQQSLKTAELQKKLNEYQKQIQKGSDKASKIGKQIKSFESQITSMKKIAYEARDQKQRISIDYEKIIEQLSLRIENISEKRMEQQEKYQHIYDLLKKKQDENYDLGQMAVSFRQQISTIRNQLQILRQQNGYLLKSLKDLSEKQQKIMRLEERVQFTEKLYEETEHKLQIQRLQYENQLKLLQEKYEQRCQKLTRIEQDLIKAQKEYRSMQDQLQDTRNRLNHKINQLNYTKAENQKQRENNIQYHEKMVAYKRIEESSEATMDDLKEENYALRRTLKESEEALSNLGKRFDSFCQSTNQCLSELLQLVKSERKIINYSIRHIKPEISSIINDCIRYLGLQRQQAAHQLATIKKNLQQEVGKNRQNLKIIKIKTNIQAELQQEISKFKLYEETLISKIALLSGEKQQNLKKIKQQQGNIAQLKQDKIRMEKQFSSQIRKKQNQITLMQELVKKNQNQFNLQRQKNVKNLQKVKLQMTDMQKVLKDRISSLQQQLSQTSSSLKSSQEQNKQMSLKISELENSIVRINKQKQELYGDLEKRTKDLMASRTECENRNKKIYEKQNELAKLQQEKTELMKQKDNIQNQRSGLEQKYKQTFTKKQETQNLLKQKINQSTAMNIRIEELEDSKKKLSAQKQQLTKSKNNQQTIISNLNKTVKQLKDQIVKNQQAANKAILQKESLQKQYTKKLKNLEGEKSIVQKQYNDLKQRNSLKQNQFSSKQKALSQQLKTSKIKLGECSSTIQTLRKEIDKSNTKINQLSGEISTITSDFQAREKKIFPAGSKLKQIMKAVGQLRSIGKQYQTSKNQLLKMTNINENHQFSLDIITDIAREISTGINRLKVQILSKKQLAKDVKIGLIQGLKNIQSTADKFNRGY